MGISTSQLAKELKINVSKIFEKLEKQDLIKRENEHWILTILGKKIGGEYKKHKIYGKYIVWNNLEELKELLKNESKKNSTKEPKKTVKNSDPRKNYKLPEYRTEDGHYVRSKAEMIIDNWLYNKNIVHAYEKRLPIEENLLSDFYIPRGKVYIEYWGYENKKEYLDRKKIKQDIYKKYNFNLIELNEKDVQNLDDVLPKMLLKYKIQAY